MTSSRKTPLRRMNISLSEPVFDRLSREADKTGVAKTAIISLALIQYFQTRDVQPVLDQLQGILEATNQNE